MPPMWYALLRVRVRRERRRTFNRSPSRRGRPPSYGFSSSSFLRSLGPPPMTRHGLPTLPSSRWLVPATPLLHQVAMPTREAQCREVDRLGEPIRGRYFVRVRLPPVKSRRTRASAIALTMNCCSVYATSSVCKTDRIDCLSGREEYPRLRSSTSNRIDGISNGEASVLLP